MTQFALFTLGFPSATGLKPLTLPHSVTRRIIMQKARRQPLPLRAIGLRQLVGTWFQVLFHSPKRGTFHLSLALLLRYRSSSST